MTALHAIDISLSSATLSALRSGGYALYGFISVQAGAASGAPAVWLATGGYMQQTEIQWDERYAAYLSPDPIAPGTRIEASATCPVAPGQTAVADAGGGLTAIDAGLPGLIQIQNRGPVPWTVGLLRPSAATEPTCAFRLFGNFTLAMAPLQRVLLTFAQDRLAAGTVVEQAPDEGLLIDLTAAPARSVSFDMAAGWSADGASWAMKVARGADLGPLLILA